MHSKSRGSGVKSGFGLYRVASQQDGAGRKILNRKSAKTPRKASLESTIGCGVPLRLAALRLWVF
jgi:hypothetical protein